MYINKANVRYGEKNTSLCIVKMFLEEVMDFHKYFAVNYFSAGINHSYFYEG